MRRRRRAKLAQRSRRRTKALALGSRALLRSSRAIRMPESRLDGTGDLAGNGCGSPTRANSASTGTKCFPARRGRSLGLTAPAGTSRRGCPTWPTWASTCSTSRRSIRSGASTARAATTLLAAPPWSDVGSPWAIGAAEGGHSKADSHPDRSSKHRTKIFRAVVAGRRRAHSASRSHSTSRSSVRPTIPM